MEIESLSELAEDGILDTSFLLDWDNEYSPTGRNRRMNWYSEANRTDWITGIHSSMYPGKKKRAHKLTFAAIVTNLGMHNSPMNILLDKTSYRSPEEKSPWPEYLSRNGVSEICNSLQQHEYATLIRGYRFEGMKSGVPSSLSPTEKLLGCVPPGLRFRIAAEGLIRVKGFSPESYPAEVEEVRDLLGDYNEMVEPENMLYATYKGGFLVDGRFTGSAIINMPKQDRGKLRVDGQQMFEADVVNAQSFLLYASRLKRRFEGDAYEILGIPRKWSKLAMVMLLNCKTREQARQALQGKMNSDFPLDLSAAEILEAMEKKHAVANEFFYTEIGRKLMHLESQCMAQFLGQIVQKEIKGYPIYDSVLAPVKHQREVVKLFKKAFTVNGIQANVALTH